MKRQDYLSWDEYFMGVAILSGMRSKDPNTQVGSCIVSGDNKILSMGYNGMPTGCDDDRMPWERTGTPLDTKYMYVCHAELNAILDDRQITGILDIGGDRVGARVLARYRPRIIGEDYQLLYVLNANRPEVRDVSSAISYLRAIESVTGLVCFGIVNNTHLCGETTADDVRKGAALAQAVSQETGIPVVCHVAHEALAPELTDLSPLFPITIRMKKPWE